MILKLVIRLICLLLCLDSAHSHAAVRWNSSQEEETVEVQYDGEIGTGIISMTSYPTSFATAISDSNTTTSNSSVPKVVGSCTSTASNVFKSPPAFGASQAQIKNTSSSGYLFPTATASSQMVTGTSGISNLSDLNLSQFSGLSVRSIVFKFHVLFWAAVAEIALDML